MGGGFRKVWGEALECFCSGKGNKTKKMFEGKRIEKPYLFYYVSLFPFLIIFRSSLIIFPVYVSVVSYLFVFFRSIFPHFSLLYLPLMWPQLAEVFPKSLGARC